MKVILGICIGGVLGCVFGFLVGAVWFDFGSPIRRPRKVLLRFSDTAQRKTITRAVTSAKETAWN